MKQKLTLKRVVIILTGLLFGAFSAYNVFVIIRDYKEMPLYADIISGVVALMFAVMAVFSLTSEIKPDIREDITTPDDDDVVGMTEMQNIGFLVIRSTVFSIALAVIFLLKLRMSGKVLAFLDFSSLYTIIYFASYVLTQLALLFLIIYYTFVLKRLPLYPRASVFLPLAALILFAVSFILEIILFFVFRVILEANLIRTVVMRPVFYLGFIGLFAYFLFPAPFLDE